jgi:GAF domain-containing protein
MTEISINKNASKAEIYDELYSQILIIINSESNSVANIGNVISILHHTFNFLWTGLYFVSNQELKLGPFQGTLACTKIKYNKGVCGTCWAKKEAIIVDDVHLFDGHIACSSLSKSEIVIPIFNDLNQVIAVMDIDSEKIANFNDIDTLYLSKIISKISPFINHFHKINY